MSASQDAKRADRAGMGREPSADAFRQLLQRLWTERQYLELLLYRLVTARLILGSDLRRFVGAALGEVEQVTQHIRSAELARAVAVTRVADGWGVEASAVSLQYLAEHAPEPAASLFAEHREAFLKLTGEIEQTSRENRRMATSALDHIRETIGALAGDEPRTTYGPPGKRAVLPPEPTRLDRAL